MEVMGMKPSLKTQYQPKVHFNFNNKQRTSILSPPLIRIIGMFPCLAQ